MGHPELRRAVGGVYLSFLLPAMMGLFAQVGGSANPEVWRASFVVIAIVGAVSTISLLSRGSQPSAVPLQVGAGLVYVVIVVVGVRPELADNVELRPIEAEALLLIPLVGLGHGLAWRFMAEHAVDRSEPDESGSRSGSNRHD
jgi:hypothetical protein